MKHFSLFFSGFFLLAALLWTGAAPALSATDNGIKILILGDSLSAGLGVDPDHAYPALVQEMLNKKGLQGIRITNGSISGSTSASALS
ncbi:MAG: arylesterase, partial [Proteobacteria bacterium]|nr:arylesterase [Pseudomonadota bacterium]